MPDPRLLAPSAVDIPAPELHEAEVLDDATELGQEVRCVIPSFDEHSATDPMDWRPYPSAEGIYYPKKGNRALVAYHEDGAPLLVWWEPEEDAIPDEVVTGERGLEGKEGPQGPKGDTGATGTKGDTGATGSTGAAGAKGDTGATGAEGPKGEHGDAGGAFTEKIGDGSTKVFTITHNLGTQGVLVAVRQISGGVPVYAGYEADAPTDNTITLSFDSAPASKSLLVVVMSGAGEAGPEGPKGATGSTGPEGPKGEAGATGAEGKAAGFTYKFKTNTEATDPAAGFVKANNATPASITSIYISETDLLANSLAAELATWDDSTNSRRGSLIFRVVGSPAKFAEFNIVGGLTDNGTWDKITVEYVTGNGFPFANEAEITVQFLRAGDKGDTGAEGAKGETGAKGAEGAAGAEGPEGKAAADWKESCRAATTANVTISTALNNGDSLDGVTLATGDRVLVKNQTTTKENGIWIVGVSPARATDADAAGELSGGSTVYVEEGTINKRRHFKIITAGSITPGTTSHEWEVLAPKDFGIVEALPTTEALKGDLCTYKAATGVYWQLVYTAEATYPWAKIGGPPLHAEYTGAEFLSTESETAQTTNAPSVTTPSVAMEADVDWGAAGSYAAKVASQPRLDLYVAATLITPNANAFTIGAGNEGAAGALGPARANRRLTLASAVAVQARYRRVVGSGAVRVYTPYVKVDPVRVG